jgi:hypothetical protein
MCQNELLVGHNSRTLDTNPEVCHQHTYLCKQVTYVWDSIPRDDLLILFVSPDYTKMYYAATIVLKKTFPYYLMSNAAKKPRLEPLFCCRNTQCPKSHGFASEQGLHIHYVNPLYIVLHIFLTYLVGLPSNSLTQFHLLFTYCLLCLFLTVALASAIPPKSQFLISFSSSYI